MASSGRMTVNDKVQRMYKEEAGSAYEILSKIFSGGGEEN
jgi:hypothetical protein